MSLTQPAYTLLPPSHEPAKCPTTELSAKERAEYPASLHRNIIALARQQKPDGIAEEVSRHLGSTQPNSISVPLDFRTLTSSSVTPLVQSILGVVDPVPRNASVILELGGTLITGVYGALSIPRQTSAETMSWYHETDTIVPVDSALGALNMTPHRIAGASSVTVQLEAQSSGRAGEMVLQSLATGLGKAIDKGALTGTGVAGQPAGLMSQSGVNEITFGGAATWLDMLDIQGTVSTANPNSESTCAFVGHSDVRERYRQIQRFTGSDQTLWHADQDSVAGWQARVTNAMTATALLAGDFSTVRVVLFGQGIELIVDPFSQSLPGRISFVASALADVGTTRPSLFVRSADSAVA